MPTRRRCSPAATIAVAFGLAIVPTGAAQAASTTVTACVKRATGAATIVTGKKARKRCPKGSTKVRWRTSGTAGQRGATGPAGLPGAAGPLGPVGPLLFLRDKNGVVLGQFMGLFPGSLPYMMVLKDGGFFMYVGSGELLPLSSPKFKTNSCTSAAAYASSSSASSTQLILALVGGPTRFAQRATSPAFGPASAWKLTSTTEAAVAQTLWERDDSGTCVVADAAFNGTLVALEQVPAPPDGAGPLTVS